MLKAASFVAASSILIGFFNPVSLWQNWVLLLQILLSLAIFSVISTFRRSLLADQWDAVPTTDTK